MTPDDSVFLPATGEDDSFLLSAKINLATPQKLQQTEGSAPAGTTDIGTSRRSKRSSGLEDGRRRTAELVARLQREREERQIRAKPSALQGEVARHKDDEVEWEDIKEGVETAGSSTNRSRADRSAQKHKSHTSADTSISREDSIAALKQRIAQARAKREPVAMDKTDQSSEGDATAGSSGLRNNAFAKIMNRPERTKPPQSVKPVKASRAAETEKKQEQASAIEADDAQSPTLDPPETARVAPQNLEVERGNRMIEKLMGSKSKSQAWRGLPKISTSHAVERTEPVAISPAPAPAPIAQTKTMTVLERIEETLREEMNTTVEATPSMIVQEGSLVDRSPVVALRAIEIDEAVSVCQTAVSEAEGEENGRPGESMDVEVAPAEENSVDLATVRDDGANIEVSEVQVENASQSLPQTPVKVVLEADLVDEAVVVETTQLALPEKLEQEWVDEEPPIAVPVPHAPSARNDLHSIFPISINSARLASMLLPVQVQAGPSSTSRVSHNTAAQNLSRFPRTTLPRTPTFARVKRRVAKDSPVKRVLQSRSAVQPAPRPVHRANPIQRDAEIASKPASNRSRPALADMSSSGHNSASRNKPSLPVVEGIARKPSSIVQIPDFTKAHKAVETKTKRIQPRITRPEPGRTPGRTSRARMIERAEFDKANRDYQKRREEAMKRYKQEKEEAAWAAEMELRNAIAFKANPLPDYIRSTRS